MGRKKRKPVSAATKPVPSNTETTPEPLSAWESSKNSGNVLYGQNQYDDAIVQYTAAIAMLTLDSSVEGLCSIVALKFALVVSNKCMCKSKGTFLLNFVINSEHSKSEIWSFFANIAGFVARLSRILAHLVLAVDS